MTTRYSLLRLLPLLLLLLTASCATPFAAPSRRFPTQAELGTSKDRYPQYQQAFTDFQRAAAGRNPKYARLRSSFYDGGTQLYQGDGYQLTIWHRLSTVPGSSHLYAGPEITFDHPLSAHRVSLSTDSPKPLETSSIPKKLVASIGGLQEPTAWLPTFTTHEHLPDNLGRDGPDCEFPQIAGSLSGIISTQRESGRGIAST